MESQHHLDVEDYVETRRGRRSPATLALLLHRHLLERCAGCRAEWELVAAEQPLVLDALRNLEPPADEGGDTDTSGPAGLIDVEDLDLPGEGLPEAEPFAEAAERVRALRVKAVRELGILVRTPRQKRAGKVQRASKRFRSRGLAELLLQESRAQVRNAPWEAESLASLVPLVLVDFSEDPPAWATRLLHRAAAHRANALRIGGDLPAAAREFSALRKRMAQGRPPGPAVLAEVASLETSLTIGQRRLGDARRLLRRALLLARRAGDRELLTRILLQEAYLQWTLGNAEATLERYDRAAKLVSADTAPYLALTVATCRVLALCDLERFSDAERVLLDHQELFEQGDDAHLGATLCVLRGRIALGFELYDEATSAFTMARDMLVEIGRYYDAALAALHLAKSHLGAGDFPALKKLARELIRLFRSQQVARETLAVVRLLVQAIQKEQLTASTLRELRRRLELSRTHGNQETPTV